MWSTLFTCQRMCSGTLLQITTGAFFCTSVVCYCKCQTTNMKTLCKMFADRASQLHFTNTYLEARVPLTPAQRFSITTISKTPVLLNTKTASSAVELRVSSVTISAEVERCLGSGIMIGCEQTISLVEPQMNNIKYWIQQDGINSSDLPNIAYFKRILRVTNYGISL